MMEKSATVQRWIAGSLLCGALGLSACTAAQPPVASLSQAELAVRQASESKAPLYASGELQLAKEELANARLALNAQEYERARRLAEQALADARLAEARAETESTRQTARDLRLSIETLREEAARIAAAPLPPAAPTELRLAKETLASAKLALDVREYERARYLAEQALADARLAEVRAETESAQQAARDLQWSSEALRAEAVRLAGLY